MMQKKEDQPIKREETWEEIILRANADLDEIRRKRETGEIPDDRLKIGKLRLSHGDDYDGVCCSPVGF